MKGIYIHFKAKEKLDLCSVKTKEKRYKLASTAIREFLKNPEIGNIKYNPEHEFGRVEIEKELHSRLKDLVKSKGGDKALMRQYATIAIERFFSAGK